MFGDDDEFWTGEAPTYALLATSFATTLTFLFFMSKSKGDAKKFSWANFKNHFAKKGKDSVGGYVITLISIAHFALLGYYLYTHGVINNFDSAMGTIIVTSFPWYFAMPILISCIWSLLIIVAQLMALKS